MGKTRIKVVDETQLIEKKGPSRKELRALKTAKSELEEVGLSSGGRLPPSAESSRRGAEGDERTRVPQSGTQGVSTEGAVSEQASVAADRSKKVQKPGKAKPRSKKYQQVVKDLDRTKTYPVEEAVDIVKKMSYAKFNATIEAHINTAQTGLRGLLQLPYASGRKLTILAFGKGADTAGASIFGSEKTLEDIEKGQINFDLVITTPEWMPKLTKVAKFLGPKGLMPNPKNGTITDDLKKAVESFQSGKTEYKTEPKAPVIHLGLGKLNQPTEELAANVKTLFQTLGKGRIKKVTLSPTMGPSVKVDLASI